MSRLMQRSVAFAPPEALVERSPGSGLFERDDRLRVDEVRAVIGDRIGEARFGVRLDADFDLVDARLRYHTDLRFVVALGGAAGGARSILFDGYPLVQTSDRRGGPRAGTDAYTIRATSVYGRWSQDARSLVFGRRMRNGRILDGLAASPAGYADQSVLVASLPCVFNLDGAANRSSNPVDVKDAAGATHRIFLFTDDGDSGGQPWSLLDALRYLVWFYHTPEGPVSVRAFLDATAAGVGVDPIARGGFVPGSAMVDRLLVAADDLNCEATNLVEAVNLLSDAAGVRAGVESFETGGVVSTQFRVWAAADAPSRPLKLAWGGRHADGSPRYDTAKLLAGDVTRDNQLARIAVDWRDDELVTAPIVVGAVKRWEMTVPLVPGWLPEVDLDNVAPVDRDDAKALAVTPDIEAFLGDLVKDIPWYRMYHKKGAEFDAHRDVSRLWVLNEDGGFDGASYNRNAPFDDYQPFDFSTVASPVVTSRGQWTRRLRPMLATITRDDDGNSLGVVVEVSYDAGVSWHPPVGSVQIDKQRAAIRFNLSNPTAMVEPGGDFLINNMWFALIDQVFRVRVTAVFESDDRLRAEHAPNPAASPTMVRRGALVYQPSRFAFASREGTTNALIPVYPGQQTGEVDQTPEAVAAARRLADQQQSGSVEAVARIAWLDDELGLGDRVVDIAGRDVSLVGLARGAAVGAVQWQVVGKVFQIGASAIETMVELSRVAVGTES